MKHLFLIFISLMMTLTLTACPDGLFGKKDKGGQVATAPPSEDDRGGCRYDVEERRYRYEDGTSCNYNQYYDENACYNYYYNSSFDRYYNQNGDPVDCNNDYINYGSVYPYGYYNYNAGYTYWGCPYGYIQVPVGFGQYVCAADPYSNNSLNFSWWFWLNL